MSSKQATASNGPLIEKVEPSAAIYGGEIDVHGAGFFSNGSSGVRARFGSVDARLVISGDRHLVIRVPEEATDGNLTLENDSAESSPYSCSLGITIAENLHPVSNPAVDAEGNIYTTRSGSRGEKVPVSVFKIDLNFNVKPFVSDIVNPTGLIFDKSDNLLISSRNNGTIYSVGPKGEVEVYAEGMGVATGMAFDSEDNLYVGDRTGTIFKISPSRQIFVFATIEPSIAAYHLAMGPGNELYVAGPTTSSFDSIYCVHPNGEVDVVCRGFGRPQGMAFDQAGNLYLAASYGGRKGVFLLSPGAEPERVVSGPGIVGLAFLPTKELVVATTSSLYRVSGGFSSRN
jgi:sugar lactone lactonase YvrE